MVVRASNSRDHRSAWSSAPIIKELRPGGPAWCSGRVQQGDMLVSVDGCSVAGRDAREISAMILGPAGSSVNLVVRSVSSGGTVSVDLVRRNASRASITETGDSAEWSDEVKDAIEAATAMHAHGKEVGQVVRALLAEVQGRDDDVMRVLASAEDAFSEAQLSVQAAARRSDSSGGDGEGANPPKSEGSGRAKSDVSLVEAAAAERKRSAAALERLCSLVREALRQVAAAKSMSKDMENQLAAAESASHEQQVGTEGRPLGRGC